MTNRFINVQKNKIMAKGLKIQLPSAVTDAEGLRKLEHYYGIEFTRGASNGGGDNGYHKMIGDETLLKEMRFHNQMKIVTVGKDAAIKSTLNQVNWNKMDSGDASVIDGSDDTDVIQAHTKNVYAIIGGTNPTYERYIVSDQPFTYDGDEAKEYLAYGETPDYVTLLNGVVRSIRNDDVDGTHGAGNGTNHSSAGYGTAEAGGYPKTQLSRFAFEQYARAKNTDPNSNLPYMNICNQDVELTQAFMFIEFRTKQLNGILGHGMSTVSIPTKETWGKVSGFRITTDNGATYKYVGLGTNLYLNSSTTGTTMWAILNGSCPLLKMFEAQLAVSNGDTLEAVNNSDGEPVQGLSDGVMTGIWTKTFSFKVNASLTSGGAPELLSVDAVLRVPVWRGRTRLWGNCSQWYSGYELLRYLDEGGLTHHKIYRSPSVEALVKDSDVTDKTEEGQFEFEKKYNYLGELPTITVDAGYWAKETHKDGDISTPLVKTGGGALSTYESAFFWAQKHPTAGTYSRRGARFGGYAYGGDAALRYASCFSSPSGASTNIGSGFRVELSD